MDAITATQHLDDWPGGAGVRIPGGDHRAAVQVRHQPGLGEASPSAGALPGAVMQPPLRDRGGGTTRR